MTDYKRLIIYIILMAGVTYLIRMLPLAIFKKKIESKFVKSFLYYVPYAVLGAMTFPDIFYSTSYIMSAIFGLVVGLILSYMEKSLITVALSSCMAVFVAEAIIKLI